MVTKSKIGTLDLPARFLEENAGYTDGSADVATEFASFLGSVRDGYFPGLSLGSYLMSSATSIALVGTEPGERISLRGGGPHNETFKVNNATGGLSITGSGVGRQHKVHLADMQFSPQLPDSGYPLKITGTAGGLSLQNAVVSRDIYFGSEDEGDSNDFNEGPSVTGLYRPDLNAWRVGQSSGSLNKWPHILDISDCYFTMLTNFWANVATAGVNGGATIGIKDHGSDEEAYFGINNTTNGADTGHSITRDGREPQHHDLAGHTNSKLVGKLIDGVKYGITAWKLMYMENTPVGVTPIDFKVIDADGHVFAYNQFRLPNPLRRHYWLEPDPVKVGAVVRRITILMDAACLFSDTGVAPIYCNGATEVVIHLPDATTTNDFVSYPRKLVEMGPNQDPREIKIVTPSGVISMAADASHGPNFTLDRQSPSPADGDRLGKVVFAGDNDAASRVTYAAIGGVASDVSAGSHDGRLPLNVAVNGTETTAFEVTSAATDGLTSAWALVNKGGAVALQQMKVGAAGTGPIGGTSRAVYFD